MNIENWNDYWQSGGTYIVPNELVIEVFDELENWKKEAQTLKDNQNELKKWLEDNWKQSQDIWFVKIINKMEELEKESGVV